MSNDNKFIIYINGTAVEVSQDIYEFYKRSEWREDYYLLKRKQETFELNNEKETFTVTPSKEDSLERLVESGKQFPDTAEAMEEQIIRSVWLKNALDKLSGRERFIIEKIYFDEITERDLARILGTSQVNLHKIKRRILIKLHKLLK